MFHANRTWKPPQSVDKPQDLAESLTQHTFTLCSAFEHRGYLYLNDATSEDRVQEYAILKKCEDGSFTQIESVSFSWCTPEEAQALIERTSRGDFDSSEFAHLVEPLFDESAHHSCSHCR